MAYGNYIAAVDWNGVLKVRSGAQKTLKPLTVVVVSHLTAYWDKRQPLGSCLAQILDGGQELSPHFWHPFRSPVVHSPDEAQLLQAGLQKALTEVALVGESAHGLTPDLVSITAVLKEVVTSGAAIVSVLEPPADEERASRVDCPFDEPDKLPIPWGHLTLMFKNFR